MRLTSIAAYNEMKANGSLNSQRGLILKIVAQRANMSLREIQKEINKNRSRKDWIDVGTISARVCGMKDDEILATEKAPRKCLVSGRSVHPVYVVG